MHLLPKTLFVAACSIATTGIAAAQDASDAEAPAEGEAAPTEATEATEPAAPAAAAGSLTLGKGKILIAGGTLNINLSSEAVAKPLSLAPSIWYGVSDKLTIGLTHDFGSTPWTPRPVPGTGICLSGTDSGCGDVYSNFGLDALFALKAGKFSLAAHPGLDVGSFDPFVLRLRVGVLGQYSVNDKISIAFDPRIGIGLTEREINKESIDIPVYAWYKINPKLGAYVSTGIGGPLDGFGDFYAIPLGLGATYQVNEKMGLGADFFFTNMIGSGGGFDGRALGLRFAYAL